MTGEELLQEWYRERGSKAKRLTPAQEESIKATLAERFRERENPQPLEYCAACGVQARGLHHQSPVRTK